jgi:hypothetical protein
VVVLVVPLEMLVGSSLEVVLVLVAHVVVSEVLVMVGSSSALSSSSSKFALNNLVDVCS